MKVAHQRIIRERKAIEEGNASLFGRWWENVNTDISTAVVREVSYATAAKIILEYEWLGNMGTTEHAYGLYFDGECGGVACFGRTAGTNVYTSVFGPEFAGQVITLCRGACVHWAHPHSASKLITAACKMMKQYGYHAFIAYGDPVAGEIGTVYQACGWLYCGMTSATEQFITLDGQLKDARLVHAYTRDRRNGQLKYKRTRAEQKAIMESQGYIFTKGHPKHRYVGLYGDKRTRRLLRENLKWPDLAYPKRDEARAERN